MLRCNFGYIGEILQNLTELQMQGNQNVSKARDAIYRAYANVTAIGDELESGFPCHQDDTSLATTSMCLPYSSLTLFIDVSHIPFSCSSLIMHFNRVRLIQAMPIHYAMAIVLIVLITKDVLKMALLPRCWQWLM